MSPRRWIDGYAPEAWRTQLHEWHTTIRNALVRGAQWWLPYRTELMVGERFMELGSLISSGVYSRPSTQAIEARGQHLTTQWLTRWLFKPRGRGLQRTVEMANRTCLQILSSTIPGFITILSHEYDQKKVRMKNRRQSRLKISCLIPGPKIVFRLFTPWLKRWPNTQRTFNTTSMYSHNLTSSFPKRPMVVYSRLYSEERRKPTVPRTIKIQDISWH